MTGLVPRPHRPRFAGPHRRFGDYVRQVRLSKRIGLRACAEAIGLAAGHYSTSSMDASAHQMSPRWSSWQVCWRCPWVRCSLGPADLDPMTCNASGLRRSSLLWS